MSNFGELSFGDIPEPLKYVRPFQITTLSNGVRVCTEKTNHQTASIGVFVNAGSRQEDLETSGIANLTQKMFLRGTTNRSKSDISQTVESMGARLSQNVGREHSNVTL
jgi:predicted Zn-dependent peptidase